MNLDGIWEFAFTARRDDVPVYDSFAPVPGCFDSAGLRFGEHGCGWYRKRVECGGRLRLRIASSGLRTAVFIDGSEIGESALAWSPFALEFTLKNGIHELVMRTDNLIEDHPLFRSFYDFYGFGGIYDHVTLEDVKPDEIRSLQVLPLDCRTGEVEIRVETSAERLNISFDGTTGENIKAEPVLRRKVPDFRLWSPETPNLHTLTVNGKTVEFGIRTLDWSGKRLLMNGKELKLIGLNRHESHPEFGAATPESLIASDLLQIRRAGFNFIRGSHYPQREFLFRMCDRLGLMVWEEPLAWGNNEGTEHPRDLTDPVFMDSLASQLKLTVRSSFNHPSLIIHGFLNECASDTQAGRAAIARMAEICRRLDPSRPVTFASNRPDRDICFDLADIISMNVYPGWYSSSGIEEVFPRLAGLAEKFPDKPLMVSEIGASSICGDHSGNHWSEEYQSELCLKVLETVRKSPRYTGVAFWMYANANSYIDGQHALSRPRGFNNKGFVDEYRRPKAVWESFIKALKTEEGK